MADPPGFVGTDDVPLPHLLTDGVLFGTSPLREVARQWQLIRHKKGAIEESLNKSCRVEMPGIYFDVDLATLKPVSSRALTTIAELLRRQPQWRLSIEGHTDNSGGEAHNQDLSTRRAATVRAALARDFAIVPGRLTSAGFGANRPVETNDTITGRAHNRRVELVRDCSGKPWLRGVPTFPVHARSDSTKARPSTLRLEALTT